MWINVMLVWLTGICILRAWHWLWKKGWNWLVEIAQTWWRCCFFHLASLCCSFLMSCEVECSTGLEQNPHVAWHYSWPNKPPGFWSWECVVGAVTPCRAGHVWVLLIWSSDAFRVTGVPALTCVFLKIWCRDRKAACRASVGHTIFNN